MARGSVFRDLSFPNAVQAIAASFDDARDAERPRFSSAARISPYSTNTTGFTPSLARRSTSVGWL